MHSLHSIPDLQVSPSFRSFAAKVQDNPGQSKQLLAHSLLEHGADPRLASLLILSFAFSLQFLKKRLLTQ
jgi:hypothetical protein